MRKLLKLLFTKQYPQTILDAWALIGIPAMFGGMFMGAGAFFIVFGGKCLGLDHYSGQIQAIPIFLGLLIAVWGMYQIWTSIRKVRNDGYLDVMLARARKLEKQNRRER